jgi:hypothetical protein
MQYSETDDVFDRRRQDGWKSSALRPVGMKRVKKVEDHWITPGNRKVRTTVSPRRAHMNRIGAMAPQESH